MLFLVPSQIANFVISTYSDVTCGRVSTYTSFSRGAFVKEIVGLLAASPLRSPSRLINLVCDGNKRLHISPIKRKPLPPSKPCQGEQQITFFSPGGQHKNASQLELEASKEISAVAERKKKRVAEYDTRQHQGHAQGAVQFTREAFWPEKVVRSRLVVMLAGKLQTRCAIGK